MASQPPLLIADHRRPGKPMASLPLKLPADAVPRLQAQADRLRCNKTALGRTLLLRGLEDLEQATTAQPQDNKKAAAYVIENPRDQK